MSGEYTITVIQNEKPPLSAMPVNTIPGAAWVWIVLGVMLLLMVAIYLVYCSKYQQKLECLSANALHRETRCRSFNYFRLKEYEKDLERQILDQDDIKNFL